MFTLFSNYKVKEISITTLIEGNATVSTQNTMLHVCMSDCFITPNRSFFHCLHKKFLAPLVITSKLTCDITRVLDEATKRKTT